MIGKLYTFKRCPYAIRARMALALANLEYRKIEVDLKNKPKDMLEHSSKGTVPILVLNSGEVIDESLEIIDWVLEYSQSTEWKALSQDEILQGEALLNQLTDYFIPALNRYKYAPRYQNVSLESEEEILLSFFIILEKTITTTNILSNKPSKYDIGIFPLMRQANIANSHWLMKDQFNQLAKWFEFWRSSEILYQIMQKE